MKRNSIGVFACVLVGAAALYGCKTMSASTAPSPQQPIAIAKQACEINALAEEREAFMKSVYSDDPGAPPASETSERRKTILSEKLRRYSAEVEASYRFVVGACNSYNLCMENNGYREEACDQSRKAWVASHEKFNELTARLAEIRRGSYGGGHGHGGGGWGDKCDCTNQGGVFSGGCCDDGD